jgi:hypothetical protein
VGSAQAWTPTKIDQPPPSTLNNPLQGISCPSTELCVAVDGAVPAKVVTSVAPAKQEWKTPFNVDPNEINSGISCPSAELCVTGDLLGNIVSSTTPTSEGKWKSTTPTSPEGATNHRILSVSCPTVEVCVAVGDNGNVVTSTNANDSVPAWHTVNVDGTFSIKSVSCPTINLCVASDSSGAVGHILWSTSPTGGKAAWNILEPPAIPTEKLNGVSCASETLCVAVGEGGNVVTSTEPNKGLGWTATTTKVDTAILRSVSCPSAALCVAGDDGGAVVTSMNPTGGASAWSQPSVLSRTNGEKGGIGLKAVSCVPGFCAIVNSGFKSFEDFGGEVFIETDVDTGGPPGAKGATGATGPTGATGAAGSNGAKGAAGSNGSKGVTGATGPTGPAGSNGINGSNGVGSGGTGPAGSNGANGSNGAAGAAGSNGANGAAGSNGANGAAGSNGANGATGATGPTGPTGEKGATGPAGNAAIATFASFGGVASGKCLDYTELASQGNANCPAQTNGWSNSNLLAGPTPNNGVTPTNLYADTNATVKGSDTATVEVIDNTTEKMLLSCTVNSSNVNHCFATSGSGSAAPGDNIEVKITASGSTGNKASWRVRFRY